MKKLLVILLFCLLPALSSGSPCDTVKYKISIEQSLSDLIVKSLESDDFSPLSGKMQPWVILIAKSSEDKFERFLVPKEEIVHMLNKLTSNIQGIAKVYKEQDGYFIIIEGEGLDHPMLIGLGVDGGMIFKILIE